MDNNYIYILKLQNKKYYVGRSKNVFVRIQQHKDGEGAEWTKIHQFVKLKKIVEGKNPFSEDYYTLKMMSKYGIDNVRGGSFCKINLSIDVIDVLELMIKNSQDKCFNCDRRRHNGPCLEPKLQCKYCKKTNHDESKCFFKTINAL